MAALIKHGLLANPLKSTTAILAVNTASVRRDITRLKSKKPVKKVCRKLEATKESIASKGFLRPQKAYTPPADVCSLIDEICKRQETQPADETKLEDPRQRFNILMACIEEFNHSVPNSELYTIQTIGDLKQFYQTPIETKTPLDSMRTMDLPKNLHISYEYVRFHPNTDTMFGGKTAFPQSSTIVSGLKYKKQYPGHKEDDPFLNELLKI